MVCGMREPLFFFGHVRTCGSEFACVCGLEILFNIIYIICIKSFLKLDPIFSSKEQPGPDVEATVVRVTSDEGFYFMSTS